MDNKIVDHSDVVGAHRRVDRNVRPVQGDMNRNVLCREP